MKNMTLAERTILKDQENMPFVATQIFAGVDSVTGRYTTIREATGASAENRAADRIAAIFFGDAQLETSVVKNGRHRIHGRAYQAYKRNFETNERTPVGNKFYVR